MGRRAARKARSEKTQETIEMERRKEEESEETEQDGESSGGGFFACYLLCSLSPRHKGHTYIGFTVNPRRRIRQHNGEIRSGAWRTKRGRPWEMILCIYGFPTNVSALQFEWAWQHPTESLAVRKAASNFKSLSGIANKIKIAYTMLNLPSWENLNLTVNFFSTKYMKHLGGCPRLPKQMKVNVHIMDDLPCYVEGQIVGCNNSDGDETDYEEEEAIENVSPTKSDTSNSGIKEDAYPSKRSSPCDFSDYEGPDNFRPETCCLAVSSKPSEGYDNLPSSRILSSCSVQDSFIWPQQRGADSLRQPSPLRVSNNDDEQIDIRLISPTVVSKTHSFCDNDQSFTCSLRCSNREMRPTDSLLLSPQGNVINLSTPSSRIVGKCNKRAKVCSEVIDLTDSPIIIQL